MVRKSRLARSRSNWCRPRSGNSRRKATGFTTAPSFQEKNGGCFFGYYTAVVRGNGDMYPCCMLINPEYKPIGNAMQGTFGEQWNGEGYPCGLRATSIPVEARLLAVADAFDAMTSVRPYRAARSHAEAFVELENGAGSQFDPGIVEAFLAVWQGEALPVAV